MPLQRFSKLEPDRQNAILDAAAAEFAQHGFSGASYNAIIKRAGLSKGAMYYYFADKADLCRTVLDRALEQLWDAVGELGAYDDAPGYWREIHALSDRASAVLFSSPELGDLSRMIYGEGGNTEVLAPLIERAEAWCEARLAEGRAVGAVRDDLPLSLVAAAVTGVLVHTDRWFGTHLQTLDPASLERLGAACLEMIEQLASPRRR